MEYIKIKELPDKAAQEAYSNGYYIKAIQILHSFIENQCRGLLMLIGNVHFDAVLSDIWDLSDTISFNECIRILYILNHISKDEYNFNKSMNSLRNKVIHSTYKEPYNMKYEGIPKSEYDEIFNKTLEQTYIFMNKCEEIIEIKKRLLITHADSS